MSDNYTFEWRGPEIVERVHTAIGRGQVALAETVVSEAKQTVHRLTGTLSRSIHAAPANYEGAGDQEIATEDDLGAVVYEIPTWEGDVAVTEVGSWIDYACVEESRHPYLAPAVELALDRAPGIFQQAFAEEGLTV